MISSVKQRLKLSKAYLNARKAGAALDVALAMTTQKDDEARAIAHHRAAMAYKALHLSRLALEQFNLSYNAFERVEDEYRRTIGMAIVVRDTQLFKLMHVYSTSDQPRLLEASALFRSAKGELEGLESTQETELELVVTEAFINRAEIIIEGPTLPRRQRLHDDWLAIRELRGQSDTIYELDALDWLLDRGEFPRMPNALVLRAFMLAMEVRNPVLMAKYAGMPGFNSARWLFGRVFD